MAADPHMLLAAASLVPGLGSLAAAMDMALYLYEGDSFNAALAAAALIPGGAMLAIGVGKGARALFNLARSGAKDLGAAVKASRVVQGLAGAGGAVSRVVSRVSTKIEKWTTKAADAGRTVQGQRALAKTTRMVDRAIEPGDVRALEKLQNVGRGARPKWISNAIAGNRTARGNIIDSAFKELAPSYRGLGEGSGIQFAKLFEPRSDMWRGPWATATRWDVTSYRFWQTGSHAARYGDDTIGLLYDRPGLGGVIDWLLART